jgi:predicted DNA-binding transcriptional regulator YafY
LRADRLLSMLMILQSRGKVTARELASELEVSVRTVHRDVVALSSAGVPVYAERGSTGGIALIERYRSDLTGLTKEEVRALFMMNIPSALTELGVGQELQAAMLKLSAALPATFREDERGVRQRIHIDPTPWENQPALEAVSDLKTMQDALWESRVLEIRHTSWLRPDMEPLRAMIHPYGLVAKARIWYLVGKRDDHIAVIRVDRIVEVQESGQTFGRPEGFDLLSFWKSYCQDQMENRPVYPVVARLETGLLHWLSWSLGERVQMRLLEDRSPDQMGRTTLELRFEYFDQALKGLLPMGRAIEVLEPVALRCSIKDYAEQILTLYA